MMRYLEFRGSFRIKRLYMPKVFQVKMQKQCLLFLDLNIFYFLHPGELMKFRL